MEDTSSDRRQTLDPRIADERTRLREACGRNIRRLMIAKGWSQSELARASELGRDRISKYVRGVYLPQTTHLELIANALGVRARDLTKPSVDAADGVITLQVRGQIATLDIEDLYIDAKESRPLIDELCAVAAAARNCVDAAELTGGPRSRRKAQNTSTEVAKTRETVPAAERDQLRIACGNNIRRLMAARRWSQSDLAKECGISRGNISDYVQGTYLPDVMHLDIIASALGVRPEDLVTRERAAQAEVRVEHQGEIVILNISHLPLRIEDAFSAVDALLRMRKV